MFTSISFTDNAALKLSVSLQHPTPGHSVSSVKRVFR